MTTDNVKIFAFVVDNEVIGTIHVSPEAPNYERLVAGLSSNPTVVDTTLTPDVKHGWVFDGESFINPEA